MPLSFQPACLPVARGGLPHNNLSQAVSLLLKTTPIVLALPQLACRNFRERICIQSALGFPGLVVDNLSERVYVNHDAAEHGIDRLSIAYLQDDVAAGMPTFDDTTNWMETLRTISQGFQGRALKSRLLGPISLGLQLTDEQQRPLIYDPMLLDALTQHLALRAAWQAAQLANLVDDIIICLEEPFLDGFGSPFCPLDWDQGCDLLEQVFVGITGCRGIASGGAVNWAAVLDTSVEFILLDAYTHSASLIAAASALPAFLERSGVIAWGLIPADEQLLAQTNATAIVARFERILDALADEDISREAVLTASLISTNMWLEQLPVAAAERALQLCADVSAQLRAQYTLE